MKPTTEQTKDQIIYEAEEYACLHHEYNPEMWQEVRDAFIAGAEWMAAHQRDGWISVKDRLPEHRHRVLAFGVSIHVGLKPQSYIAKYYEEDEYNTHCWSMGASELQNVTHWQYLPSAPQTQDNG